jgi:methylthioribose-1-phosphate isomerase
MKVHGTHYRSIWPIDERAVGIIDQTQLPHAFVTRTLTTAGEVHDAIQSMVVRGAPLIGVAGAYGLALAMRENPSDEHLAAAAQRLAAARPTAVNLRWALERMHRLLMPLPAADRRAAAWQEAARIADEDVELNRAIGRHGAALIRDKHRLTQRPVQVLTHCNAGWVATVDHGTALAPIYEAHDAGVPVHVWVDETRPRGQGLLTAWELAAHGVPHTVITDNAGGHLMQHGRVDMVLVGADRVTARGDVANKIGTYLKALAAHANRVPFYAAVPSPTIDWSIADGVTEIPIEERSGAELREISGRLDSGETVRITVLDPSTAVANPAFDVTPGALVTGIVTERGIVAPAELSNLFPEQGPPYEP